MTTTQPFNVHTLHALRRLSGMDNHLNQAVFSKRSWDESTKTTTINLNTLSLEDNTPKILTNKTGIKDTSAAYSPDGKYITFLSSRSSPSQIWIMPANDNNDDNARILTTLPLDVEAFRWSPTGDYLIVALKVFVDCATLSETVERDKAIAARGANTGFIFDSLYIRHWDQWESGKHLHLFKINMKKDDILGYVMSSDEPIDLMKGMNATSPVPPFGGIEHFAISKKGNQIAFTAEMIKHNTSWTTGWKTFLVDITGNSVGTPYSISDYTEARTQNPSFSPDGKYLAYLSMDRPGYESDKLHLVLYDLVTKQTTHDSVWDRSISEMIWSPDSNKLYLTADEDGRHKLFVKSLKTPNSIPQCLLADGHNTNLIAVDDHTLLVARDFLTGPADIWKIVITESGNGVSVSSSQQVTFLNSDLLNQVAIEKPSTFYFEGGYKENVQGWILKPFGFQSDKKYPTVLLIHGGPQGAWTDAWSYRWNPQLWSSHGYAVIMINVHGSTGFGQNFTDAVCGDWGGVPYEDLMTGLEYAIQHNSWIDQDRLCACGASYGGFMVNWINGKTNRFKCLVSHDGVFDSRQNFYSTEELFFPEWEFKGTPYESDLYEKWNPSNYVTKWQTPTLVIHGGKDYRLPPDHGIAVFTALKRRNIPSRLLYFPEENHWVLNPANSIMWYDTVLAWLDQWTVSKQ